MQVHTEKRTTKNAEKSFAILTIWGSLLILVGKSCVRYGIKSADPLIKEEDEKSIMNSCILREAMFTVI